MSNLIRLSKEQKEWYQVEKNTGDLLKAILAETPVSSLSGDGIWHLLRLTWITRAKSDSFWKELKAPALEFLCKRKSTSKRI